MNMKKLLFIILILFMLPSCVEAKSSQDEIITSVENTLFGYNYNEDSNSKRVERIESYLYGSKKKGNLEKRLTDIKNNIGYTEQTKVVEEKSSVDTSVNNQMNTLDKEARKLKENATVDYPIVDKLENEVFKTTYKNEDIYSRLNRLEQQVFAKTSNSSLNDRVDRLTSVINPKKTVGRMNKYEHNYGNMEEYYANSGLEPISDNSLPFQLAALEQDLLRNDFQNENISERLSRLENKLFKKTFESDSDISRLQRIMVAYDAKKNSYKYDSNKTMQNMATVSQLGGILLMILAILL